MAKYRKIRTDIFTHERTDGIGAVGRDILLQGILANIAGLLRCSVRVMARTAGVEPCVIEAALADLQRRGLVRWWADHEILWVLGAAEEQAQNAKAWVAVLGELQPMPAVVRHSFAAFYHARARVPDHVRKELVSFLPEGNASRPADTIFPQEAGTGSRKQEQEQQAPRPAADAPAPAPDPDDRDDPEVREIGNPIDPPPVVHRPAAAPVEQALFELAQHHGTFVGEQPAGAARERVAAARPMCRDDAGRANLLRELQARGLDGVLEVLRFGWAEVAAGRWEPQRVGAFAFSKSGGWFDKLVAERAAALAKTELAEQAMKRREDIDRAEAERAAQARASPTAATIDIDAVTRRLRTVGATA